MKKLIPVLLAGGIGSRLWPLSREHYPKQFLTLLGNDSLLQATIRRVLQHTDIDQFIVVCNEAHRFEVLQQIEQLNPSCDFTILLEPEGRNTAAAAALVSFYVNPEDQILLIPADHLLNPVYAFLSAVQIGQSLVEQDKLVTFGIAPAYPETGYGYIQAGQKIQEDIFSINQFIEKPSLEKAEQFVNEGCYFWNSGIFLFSAKLYLTELQKYAPDIFSATQQCMQHTQRDGKFLRGDQTAFLKSPNISIDYAVMEHVKNAAVVRLGISWNDIGSWQALYEYETKDARGNVIKGDVIDVDNQRCYVRSSSRLVAAVGLTDTLIVETPDSILVVNQDKTQAVKQVVAQLQAQKRPEATRHIVQYHPWGTTTLLNAENNFRVYRVDVMPGKSLSLHSHEHRNEHWIVLSGEATVLLNQGKKQYQKDQSFYITASTLHSIQNNSKEMLSLVEVQSGEVLETI